MRKALLAFVLLSSYSTVSAGSLLYAGISAGQSDFNSDDDINYGIHVGTGILPLLDVEAGYTEHGEFAVNGGNVSLSSTYAAVRPTFSLGDIQIYAKAGVHYWSLDAKRGAVNFRDSDEYDVMWGVGAEYAIFGPISVGASYTNFKIDDEDVDAFNITASFNFL